MKIVIFALAALLGACANFYVPPPGTPTAKVRFVATAGGNTEFIRSSSARCDAKYHGQLGWFNPSGGQSFQAGRRGFDRREGIADGQRYPPHMYSEMRVDAATSFFVTVASTTSGGSFSPFDARMCVRAVELFLEAGREYELIHLLDRAQCDLKLFEIVMAAGGVERREITPKSKSPVCTGWGTPRS